jgi:hypothetical protein
LHAHLLALVNQQQQTKGLILQTCPLVDATLLQAVRRRSAIKPAVMVRLAIQ